MPHLRKKGDLYYAEFYDRDRHPNRKWVPLNTKNKRTAMTRLVELDLAYARGDRDPWTDGAQREGVTLTEAIEDYIKARSDRRPKTLRADRSLLEMLAETLPPDVQVKHIEPKRLASFLAAGNRSEATQRTYHTHLKTFFKWCHQKGLVKVNPMATLRPPRQSETVAEFLTKEQYERLLRCIQGDATLNASRLKDSEVTWLLDVVKVAVGTGMRLAELCNMRWSWVNLKTGFVTVKNDGAFKTKSGNERSIYVTGEARATLRRLHGRRRSERDGYVFESRRGRKGDAEKLNEEYVSKRFLHYARLAKLPAGVHFHTLRHTYASWLAQSGVDMFRIQKLLGHADISTTNRRYAHLAPDNFLDALEGVFGAGAKNRIAEPLLAYAA